MRATSIDVLRGISFSIVRFAIYDIRTACPGPVQIHGFRFRGTGAPNRTACTMITPSDKAAHNRFFFLFREFLRVAGHARARGPFNNLLNRFLFDAVRT